MVEKVTHLRTSILPKVNEMSCISTSSGLAERARSRARISSIPWSDLVLAVVHWTGGGVVGWRKMAYWIRIDDDLLRGHVVQLLYRCFLFCIIREIIGENEQKKRSRRGGRRTEQEQEEGKQIGLGIKCPPRSNSHSRSSCTTR